MARFALYDVVADERFLLNADQVGSTLKDVELGFDPRADFGVRSVLTYMVDPGSASGVTFKMSVSNLLADGSFEFKEIVPSSTLPSTYPFLRQEVIAPNTLKRVNTGIGVHKLRIQVSAGAAYFSDIVHLYQINT